MQMRLGAFAICPQRNPSTLRSCAWREERDTLSTIKCFPAPSQLLPSHVTHCHPLCMPLSQASLLPAHKHSMHIPASEIVF